MGKRETFTDISVTLPADRGDLFDGNCAHPDWLAVYTPFSPNPVEIRPQFWAAFNVNCVTGGTIPDGVASRTIPSGVLYSAKWTARAEVIPVDKFGFDAIDQLIGELARLDARNVSRDRVFREREVRLRIRPYPTSLNGRPRTRLAVTQVTVVMEA